MSVEETKKIDYLREDPEIYGQKWVCLSFLTPETIKMKSDVRSVKVRGIYGSEEEAKQRCEEIRHFDNDFNVYIAPVGKWLPWCDDPEKAKDFNYANDKLNNMMKSYYENQSQAKNMFEKRKSDMIKQSIEQNKKQKEKNESQVNSEVTSEVLKEVDERYNKEVEQQPENLSDQILNTENKINDIDNELKKAEELYQKMLEQE